MKRPRPHIPLKVRVKVAERQILETNGSVRGPLLVRLANAQPTWSEQLTCLLGYLGFDKPELHHDPALILRDFNPRTGRYSPPANDPNHLVYLEKVDHQQRTTGRKPGAERTVTTKGSDIWLKTKFARLEKPKRRRKQKIPSRPFPSTRPLDSPSSGRKGSS